MFYADKLFSYSHIFSLWLEPKMNHIKIQVVQPTQTKTNDSNNGSSPEINQSEFPLYQNQM